MLIGATLVAVAMGAAAAAEPINGAFGLEFAVPVPESMLGASVTAPPYPHPPANLPQATPQTPNGELQWYLFTPATRPQLLESPDARFLVMLDANRQPLRVLAEHPAPDCAADLLWLTDNLGRKYRAEADPYGVERQGFERSARFAHGDRQVDVSCGPRLLIEYTDAGAYAAWLRHQAAALRGLDEREAKLERLRATLERERDRQFADTFTAGEQYTLEGAWGIGFDVPFRVDASDAEPLPADEPMAIEPGDPGEPFAAGAFTITVGPSQVPIRLAGVFPDPEAALFRKVAAAFAAKYGKPMRDAELHKIHKVNGDHLIARWDADDASLHVTFIDGSARRDQKLRLLAAQQQQFDQETAGL